MLTWWQGRVLQLGFGQGEDEIYNTSYQPVARVLAGNGYRADLHEFLLTPQGTAWIDAFDPVDVNLARDGRLAARRRQRLRRPGDRRQDRPRDVGVARARAHPAARLLRPDARTRATLGLRPRQLDRPRDGRRRAARLARDTWAIYDVNMHTGGFIWRIGGTLLELQARRRARASTGSTTREWQPGGLVSVFDNGSTPPEEKQSRGLVLDPNTDHAHGHARQAVHEPRRDAARRQPGQPAAASPTATG